MGEVDLEEFQRAEGIGDPDFILLIQINFNL
jgi:hypothetical protein